MTIIFSSLCIDTMDLFAVMSRLNTYSSDRVYACCKGRTDKNQCRPKIGKKFGHGCCQMPKMCWPEHDGKFKSAEDDSRTLISSSTR